MVKNARSIVDRQKGNQHLGVSEETVEDECYREAIDLILAGIDPALMGLTEKDRPRLRSSAGCASLS
jgi:hypothetical protein